MSDDRPPQAVPICDAEGCESTMPWDMRAIQFDGKKNLSGGQLFCSPECARKGLDAMDGCPEIVTLHDPQESIDMEELTGDEFDMPPVGVRFEVSDESEVREYIDQFESLAPREWKPRAEQYEEGWV